MKTSRWKSADLEMLPGDSNRYEIIDGELYVSKQPSNYHQLVGDRIWELLQVWSRQTHAGTAITTPGLIFGEDNDVVPDVIWMSKERGAKATHPDGKYHAAPELVVEILSPGPSNERRDREAKLQLYAHQGVLEYWIVAAFSGRSRRGIQLMHIKESWNTGLSVGLNAVWTSTDGMERRSHFIAPLRKMA